MYVVHVEVILFTNHANIFITITLLQTCVFGIANLLWEAANHRMPDDQEPALSVQFEQLLESMILENAETRATVAMVAEVENV